MIAETETLSGALLTGGKEGRFVVKLRGYGLQFHKNAHGKAYSMVPVDAATRFETEEEARAAITLWRVPVNYAEVVEA